MVTRQVTYILVWYYTQSHELHIFRILYLLCCVMAAWMCLVLSASKTQVVRMSCSTFQQCANALSCFDLPDNLLTWDITDIQYCYHDVFDDVVDL